MSVYLRRIAPTASITRSHFFDVRHVSAHARRTALDVLTTIAGEHPIRSDPNGQHDIFSAFVARIWHALCHYALPFPTEEVADRLTDKAEFAARASVLGSLRRARSRSISPM